MQAALNSQVRTSPWSPARDGVSWDIPSNPTARTSSTLGSVVPSFVTLEGQVRTGVLPCEPGAGRDLPDTQAPTAWLLSSLPASPLPSPAKQHCSFCQHAGKLPVIYHTINDFVGFFILDIEAHNTALPH